MTIQLTELSLDQLHSLRVQVENEIKARKSSEANALIQLVQEKAAQLGISVDELLSAANKKGSGYKSTGVAKYANPANPSETWTGKGRKPLWFIAAIDSGKSEADLAI